MMINESSAANACLAPLNLWLVDDDESVRSLFSELLQTKGTIHCSRKFSSAEAALEALVEHTPPEAILMDINMGQMSGIEAIRPIKRLAASTRIFIMTTFYDSMKKAEAFRAGASGFFLKSDDVGKTIERIETAAADSPSEPSLVSPQVRPPGLFERALALLRAFLPGNACHQPPAVKQA